MDGKKARPRGLKRSMQEDHAKADKAARTDLHEEQVELPDEMQDEDLGDNDGFSLFDAALIEIEKGNLDIAGKFLEGAIHELQTQYDAAEKPELKLLHTLGMAWCELGIVADDYGYIDRGLSFLDDAVTVVGEDKHTVLWDTARMLLAKHCLRHQESDEVAVTAAEKDEVARALQCIDDSLALTSKEQMSEHVVRAAETLHKYAQTQPPERLLDMGARCELYYQKASELAEATAAKTLAGRALNLTDMGEAKVALEEWEAAEELFTKAMGLLNEALELLGERDETEEDRAEYLKLLGELHVQAGDVCALLDRDEASEQHYRDAQAKVLRARALWPAAVSDDLVQTMDDLVNGTGSDDEDDADPE